MATAEITLKTGLGTCMFSMDTITHVLAVIQHNIADIPLGAASARDSAFDNAQALVDYLVTQGLDSIKIEIMA